MGRFAFPVLTDEHSPILTKKIDAVVHAPLDVEGSSPGLALGHVLGMEVTLFNPHPESVTVEELNRIALRLGAHVAIVPELRAPKSALDQALLGWPLSAIERLN